MHNCPACQSPNAASAKPYLERAMDVAHAAQSVGIKRLSGFAELAAQALRAVSDRLRDYRCVDCGHRYDG
ncbi:hypothetical protein WG908_15955 [Sphingobium sp. AN641]|uniref:hypothetical protein n=1 Tax=Sphingobium sp. AN641 TaxID=3133443 RepID=UPI0030C399E0